MFLSGTTIIGPGWPGFERHLATVCTTVSVCPVFRQEVSLAILRGAVLFGLDPSVIQVRRSTMTYGVGVLNKFMRGIHPQGE